MYRTIYHIKLIKQDVLNRCLLCWPQRTIIIMKSKKKEEDAFEKEISSCRFIPWAFKEDLTSVLYSNCQKVVRVEHLPLFYKAKIIMYQHQREDSYNTGKLDRKILGKEPYAICCQ